MAPRKSLGRRHKTGRNLAPYQKSQTTQTSSSLTSNSELPSIPLTAFNQSYLDTISIQEMPALIERFSQPDAIDHQTKIIEHCLSKILEETHPQKGYRPHSLQVSVLRRLIFGIGDTLFIARTGFGKSIILHSYTIMTGLTTLQITPLTKLGEEQLQSITRIPSTSPCLLSSETKRTNPDVLDGIKENRFSHILMSPEQALSKEFKDIMLSPAVQMKIGLVAIDECHLVTQWKQFREDFANLHVLRQCLRPDVVWFGCSATMSDTDEAQVLRTGGFRTVGSGVHESAIIRCSIDRPDLFLTFHPLPKNSQNPLQSLIFLLQSGNRVHEPPDIPKTIIFLNNISQTHDVCEYLRDWMVETGNYSRESARRMINVFNSRVSVADQALEFNEFVSSVSEIRIMIATTSLGMGVNVPDVDRIVIYDFPQERSIQDTWQRIGRGGRGKDRTSHAFVFLPYWVFDSEGHEVVTGTIHSGERRKRRRVGISENSTPEGQSEPLTTKKWTKDELEQRNGLPKIWKEIVNGQCHRKPFLQYLGEYKVPAAQRTVVEKQNCCGRCNPARCPEFSNIPLQRTRAQVIKRPRKNSREFFALGLIDKWCENHAESMYPFKGRRIPMPPALFMRTPCQIDLAMLFKMRGGTAGIDIDELKKKVPRLHEWKYLQTKGEDLVKFLSSLENEVEMLYQHHLEQSKKQPGRHDENAALTPQYTEEQNDELAKIAAMHRKTIHERGNAPIIAPSTSTR